jgi:FAD-linked sulfhydryl oxidase
MKNTSFKIKDIIENQKYRPSGYYEDVMSRGVIHGDLIEMTHEEAVSLVEKYSEKNPIKGVHNDPSLWGPILWKELHDHAADYQMDIEAETRWLKIFHSWVPCGKCKTHFKNLIDETPPDLTSQESYTQWTVDIHNKVNESLGKPIFNR